MSAQYDKSARVLLNGNITLRSPELFLYASLMYAKGGSFEKAAEAMLLAIEAGMTNWNILAKDRALDTVRYSTHWPGIESGLQNMREYLSEPSNFQVSIRPLERFLTISEKMENEDYTSQAFKKFVLEGSAGVRDFYVVSYKNIENATRVVQDSFQIYQTLHEILQTGALDSIEKSIKEHIITFSKHFEDGTYPPVYLMPGIFKSGGTATNTGLFIGVEKVIQNSTLRNDRVDFTSARKSLEDIPYTVFHELMHFQQAYGNDEPGKVIYKVLEEGSATFLTTLFTDGSIDSISFAFLRNESNMKIALKRLKKDLYTENVSNWVYNEGSPEWPTDIGYHLGAEICRSYYLRQTDKRLAIHRLLRTDDLTEIISSSKYAWLLD